MSMPMRGTDLSDAFLKALFPAYRRRPVPFKVLYRIMYRNTARVEYPRKRRSEG